jgi:hypothetical protein
MFYVLNDKMIVEQCCQLYHIEKKLHFDSTIMTPHVCLFDCLFDGIIQLWKFKIWNVSVLGKCVSSSLPVVSRSVVSVIAWEFDLQLHMQSVPITTGHFQQRFSYIMPVRFIGGGNRRTRRKQSTCSKSLTNFIT